MELKGKLYFDIVEFKIPRNWSIGTTRNLIRYEIDGLNSLSFEISEMTGVRRSRKLFIFSTLSFSINRKYYVIGPLPYKIVESIYHKIVASKMLEVRTISSQLDDLLSANHYIGNRHVRPIKRMVDRLRWMKKVDEEIYSHQIRSLFRRFENLDRNVRDVNDRFLKREVEEFLPFREIPAFRKLKPRQIEAVITDEDANLIVAGAGSGKTSVMAAKAAYLVMKGLARPEDILMLAFNGKAANEMGERAKRDFGITVDALTFHKYGYDLIGEALNIPKPPPHALAQDREVLLKFIGDEIVKMGANLEFGPILSSYFMRYGVTYKSEFDFKNAGEYYDYLRKVKLLSLNGDVVASYGECVISNFLKLNGVNYVYERSYPFPTTKGKRQYQPDFYLSDYDIYLEHWGVDKKGNTAPHVDKEEYLGRMEFARATHAANNTVLIETYYHQQQDGNLVEVLDRLLKLKGVKYKPVGIDAVLQELQSKKKPILLIGLLFSFLNHFKPGNFTQEEVEKRAENHPEPVRARLFLKIFFEVLRRYEEAIRKDGHIDFHDMILKATSILENDAIPKKKYKYVLVDEFQDMSEGRKQLLLAIKRQDKDCVLMGVGDDWQSINRFAGSHLSLMTKAENWMGKLATVELDWTFRFNDQICKASTDFIKVNPLQLRKSEIKTLRKVDEKSIVIIRSKSVDESIELALQEIAKNGPASVFLIARYRINEVDLKGLARRFRSLKLHFTTVHQSKGLEADYSILVDLKTGDYSFPSKFEDDPLLSLVTPPEDGFPDAEERRLMYVALTRARHKIYICSPISIEYTSPFTRELLKKEEVISIGEELQEERRKCPECKAGSIVKKKNSKKNIDFYGCTNYPYCKKTYPITWKVSGRMN